MPVLLLDTNSLFFRAHHALPPMNTSTGEETAAIYGFSVLLLKLLREEKPRGIAFARDLPAPTLRSAIYSEYKAGRPPVPDALRTQWARLDQLIRATGAPSHAVPGYEADDVLATLARQLSESGEEVLVVSGDRDLFQTIGERVNVLFIGARGQKPERVDRAVVQQRYGLRPEQMPSWSALVGEAADNLIGVAGVGAKTATKLIQAHGSVAQLFSEIDAVHPPKLRDALSAARERVLQNCTLATLHVDLELSSSPQVKGIDAVAKERMAALFAELEFKSLSARLEKLEADGSAPADHSSRNST